ncbi:MAG TPA: FAD-dependent oxidoreductase [Verrucomicrobiae bacterium]|nr:FAD-dependent oxidoreductase [Verrucomicrobiae bacterium]
MITAGPIYSRELKTARVAADLAVVGGGLAGTCCAITAARAGIRVALVQDRPVLGGNASSEIRLWILGATSHMGNNNRWAREGGVIDEILVENTARNPEGNATLLDALLLEKVVAEPNITLLLNTAVFAAEKSGAATIRLIRAFCAQNSTLYELQAPLFCDASGDGILGYLAGAAFRVGAEGHDEFGEGFAPEHATHDLLGHSLYFYSKDAGKPVRFQPPAFALTDITKIPRWRDFKPRDSGPHLWWLEWGGSLDTVHDTETIKWELWKVAYGVWNHIKNSGMFPEAENLTLEWMGAIPGKRESRRFEGEYILRQQDIVGQRAQPDAVSYGGWAIDLHPVDGVYSEKPGCTQWHAKGVYPIPYRCLFSRNVTNLFLSGRLISASHVAFGSTRVMATCAHNGQAVGMAAALCRRHHVLPADLLDPARVSELQRELLRAGHFIPGIALEDPDDLVRQATVTASGELRLASLAPNGETLRLENASAMMLPVPAGPVPRFEFTADVAEATTVRAELRISSKPDNHTPDVTLATLEVPLPAGTGQRISLAFDAMIETPRYAFICLMDNPAVSIHLSDQRVTGILSLFQRFNRAVAKSPRQEPPPGIGIESFEFWLPQRRPTGKNCAMAIDPPIACFGPPNISNGIARPIRQPNAWVADPADPRPCLSIRWDEPRAIHRIELAFDTDLDHPMESVLWNHPERTMPFCIQDLEIRDDAGRVLAALAGNHQTRRTIVLDPPARTGRIDILPRHPSTHTPAALFEARCY